MTDGRFGWRSGLAKWFGRPHYDTGDLESSGGPSGGTPKPMLCVSCETPIPDGSNFCLNCGADLSDPSSATAKSLDEAGVAKLTRLLRAATAGEYDIEREIGRGGMGVVYMATETQLRRQVAIKVLPPSLTFGEGAIERFQREARTAAQLDHPNVIPVHRVSSGSELMWYSMKYIEGQTLENALRDKKQLDLDFTIEVLDQVADALDYAHEHDVIHRDIKPGNIMFDQRGKVIVTDFGIAKELQEGSLTASGSLLGTPYYMSPEQYLGVEITGASDQYAVAVVAFQMLAGKLPFEATTPYELLNKHVSEAPPSLAEVRPGLPSHVQTAIQRGLAKKPHQRFHSVKAFADALAGRTIEVPVPDSKPASPAWVKPVGVGALAVVLGTVGWVALSGDAGDASSGGSVNEDTLQAPAVTPAVSAGDAAIVGDTGTSGAETGASETAATRPPTTSAPVEPAGEASEPQAATLRLTINVAAQITIDDVYRIERAVWQEELGPGTHHVKLERAGYITIDTLITVAPGENRHVDITMERSQ